MTFRRLAILAILLVTATVALSGCSSASAAPLPAAQAGASQAAASSTAAPGSVCTAASASTTQGAGATPAASGCSGSGSGDGSSASANTAGGKEAAASVTFPLDRGGNYTSVKPAVLDGMLKAKDFKLVNVHSPYVGEIPGTDLWLPYDQIEQRLAEFPSDKTAKIVVYCRSGMMSDIAARALVKAGYTNVWNLEGGMSAWGQAGYSLVSQK